MIIIDVREKEEFEAEHIPDSISLPLSQFDLLAPGIIKNLKQSEVILMCRSGNRSKMALTELKKLDFDQHQFDTYDGGIIRWKSEGKPVKGKELSLPIIRQFQISASLLIFSAFIGSHLIHPNTIYLALFVGFGLALAGFTGFCPMVMFLQKMPWNKKTKANNNCCN